MNTAGKDRTEGDPQEYDRSPQCTLHGSEDQAQTSDIQKLDQKEFPLGHDYVVDTIVDSDCRCLSVIRVENVIYRGCRRQSNLRSKCQTDEKTNHTNPSLNIHYAYFFFLQTNVL